ncbi:MAG: tetratricopeptide repeat protein [Planctomycetota bacterium]|nr:tetratricopeptide repeat protein [Planctomycetota bacterium]
MNSAHVCSGFHRTVRLRMMTALLVGCLVSVVTAARGSELDELPLDSWKLLREVERYQLQIAEKYWVEQNWKTAAAEYEKFLELYEKSTGAAYAQLKWSLAQVKLRKQNTAIKDGFQTVVDYWPDSPQAVAAAYYIGRTQKEIGNTKKAKTALKEVVTKYPKHLATVYALNDLVDLATIEMDVPARIEALKKLTFDCQRVPDSVGVCQQASQQLAAHAFREGAFDDGVKALATTYQPAQLPLAVFDHVKTPLSELTGDAKTKDKGSRLADQAIAWMKQAAPADLTTPEAKTLARQTLLLAADLTAVARRDDQVASAYEAVVVANKTDDDALGRLAAWYKGKMNYDKARETYRRYANPFEGLGQVAYSFREQQKWPQAVEVYLQLLGQDAEHKVRWKQELALAHRGAQKWPEAIALYEELVRDDLANAGRWRWEVGCTHRDAGQYKEAIGHYRQCENFPENYNQMAWCHRQLKQPAEAIILYKQVAADSKPYAAWALLQVAYTREESGEQEPAIQAFQFVCKKYPKDPNAATAHAHLQQKYKISVTLGGATDD